MDWKEELEKLIICEGHFDGTNEYDTEKLESFIENLLEQEKKRMSDEVENRKMEGDCKDQNCSHDQCGTIRWYNKALNISLSIINN